MTSKKEHIEADLFCLGYTNPLIHLFIDAAVKWMGGGHRIVHHNIKILDAIELFAGKEGRKIALLHLLIDNKIVNAEIVKRAIKMDKEQKKRKRHH